MTDRLTPQDSRLLHLERAGHNLVAVSLAVLEGPAITMHELRERVEQALPFAPRFEAVPHPVPLDMARPVWARDPDFDLSRHLEHDSVDGEADDFDADRLLAQALSEPLDREHPRWLIRQVEGLPGGAWALSARVHLSLADGLDARHLITDVLVPENLPDVPPRPVSEASAPRLLGEALSELAQSPYEQFRMARSVLRLRQRRSAPPPPADLHHRRVTLAFDDLDAVRTKHGGSITDVLAALAAEGVRAAEPGRATCTVTVPYAVRSLSQPGKYDNQVIADPLELALTAATAGERYRNSAGRLDQRARQHLAVGGRQLASAGRFSPPMLVALGARACIDQTAGADVTLVNVPGPRRRVEAFGRDVVSVHAIAPHPPATRWSITAISYVDQVALAVTCGDADEIDRFVAGIEPALAEMLDGG